MNKTGRTAELKRRVVEQMRNSGLSFEDTARCAGVSADTVRSWCQNIGQASSEARACPEPQADDGECEGSDDTPRADRTAGTRGKIPPNTTTPLATPRHEPTLIPGADGHALLRELESLNQQVRTLRAEREFLQRALTFFADAYADVISRNKVSSQHSCPAERR